MGRASRGLRPVAAIALALFAIAVACCDGENGEGGAPRDAITPEQVASDLESPPPRDLDPDPPPDDGIHGDASTADPDVPAGNGQDSETTDTAPEDVTGDAAPLSCQGSEPLRCGARKSGNTGTAPAENRWSGYGCSARLESGPELVYSFHSERDCDVGLRLTGMSEDLDVFVLDACDPFSCIAFSSTPLDIQDIESVAFSNEGGMTRFVVVDGYGGAAGAFELAADCLCGANLTAFRDGAWVMEVDRRWQAPGGRVLFPHEPLREEDYIPVEEMALHPVVVSRGWSRVAVGDESICGAVLPRADGTLWYDLSEGTFAGGRFRIWVGETGAQAELTLYGSGVPFVSSERGALKLVVPLE